jgi:hypothetical protein
MKHTATIQIVVTSADCFIVAPYTEFVQNPLNVFEYKISERQAVINHTQLCALCLERGGYDYTIL